ATAFAHGATPLIIVIDNGVYATIVAHQENHYPGRPSGTRMVNPDFATWMRAFDGRVGAARAGVAMAGHAQLVETPQDSAPALDRALAADGPALIHGRIDPATMPPAADETS